VTPVNEFERDGTTKRFIQLLETRSNFMILHFFKVGTELATSSAWSSRPGPKQEVPGPELKDFSQDVRSAWKN
jgi:hypothetical protein